MGPYISQTMTSTAGPPPDPYYVFSGFSDGVSSVSFVEIDGKDYLMSGDSTGECILWNLNTMKPVWKYQPVDKDIKILTKPAVLSCGSWSGGIWAHTRGQCIQFWMVTGTGDTFEVVEKCSIPCPHIGFCAVSVLTTKATCGNLGLVAVPMDRNERTNIEIYQLTRTEGISLLANIDFGSKSESNSIGSPMCCVLVEIDMAIGPTTSIDHSSACIFIVGFESGQIQIWRISGNQCDRLIEEKMFQETILNLDYLPNRQFGVCVSPEKMIKCWKMGETENGHNSIFKFTDISLPKPGASAVRIRGDGKIFAIGGWDGKIRVFAVKSLKPLAVLQFHNATVRCIDFSNGPVNGRRLMAAGSSDGSVSVWNLY